MQNKITNLLTIILGIIILGFPILGVVGTSAIVGLSIFMIQFICLLAELQHSNLIKLVQLLV